MTATSSGQAPYRFAYRPDLSSLPPEAKPHEEELHGGFGVDADGSVYFAMAKIGLIRLSPDLQDKSIIGLPEDLVALNFHSTRVIPMNGSSRLAMCANRAGLVAWLTMEGQLDFRLNKPGVPEYTDVDFRPTDSVVAARSLYVADGYGANYVSIVSLERRGWHGSFAGKTDDPLSWTKFGTAHGMSVTPDGDSLVVADRAHDRLVITSLEGVFQRVVHLPRGSRPCGIDFHELDGQIVGAVPCLQDRDEGRDAPVYIVDWPALEIRSVVRPSEDLGLRNVQHVHSVAWREYGGRHFLLCQAWNPGSFFVLERVD